MPTSRTPDRSGLRLTLDDGTPVLLRPVRPDDAALLRDGLDHLSTESRITRFFSPVTHLTEEQLAYLTHVDQQSHVAWGAVADSAEKPAGLHGEVVGLGVGRFARLPDEPSVAEVAVTVIDEAQRHGLGLRLLAVLYCIARRRGIGTLRAIVMTQNQGLARRLLALGGTAEREDDQVTLDLPLTDVSGLPDTPEARVFKRVLDEVERALDAAPELVTPRTTRSRPPADDPS
jgi:GNAT superfamily N-acetyltransferase